ncbi:MAG: hypothetical protein FJ315_07775, partial [SAR202 cluster bacterium]|nr:hypothetical protein [SAR202 cluster bacterium]
MNRRDLGVLAWTTAAACAGLARAEALQEELRSGPPVGGSPLPFTSNLVTGPYRGKQHCYVCELRETDHPAVLVFARSLNEPTARLLRGLRDAIQERKKEKLFGWFVFLDEGKAEAELEARLEQFARENSALSLPISALGDPQGPPGYRIAGEAEVTLLYFR